MKKFIRLCAVLAATVALLGVGSITSHNMLNSFVSTEVKAEEDSTDNSLAGKTITGEDGITYTFNEDYTITVTAASSDITGEVVIFDGLVWNDKSYTVTEIADEAFKNSSITKITANSVTKVGASAFYGCSKLTTVNMPSLKEIDDEAFRGDSGITEISAKNVTEVGASAFFGCNALTIVDMPSLKETGSNAFYWCNSLQNLSFPKLDKVGSATFYNCTGLISIDLPSVTRLNNNAFIWCSKLETINMPNVTSIGDNAFRGCSSLKTVYISENFSYDFGGTVTKKYVIDKEDLKIVWSTEEANCFDVIVNTNRFGGSDEKAKYLEEVDIVVNNDYENVLQLPNYEEEGDNIIYHVRVNNQSSQDNEIRAQVQAYDWNKETGKGETAYYYVTSPETIKPATATA